jgi:hypothetical protein
LHNCKSHQAVNSYEEVADHLSYQAPTPTTKFSILLAIASARILMSSARVPANISSTVDVKISNFRFKFRHLHGVTSFAWVSKKAGLLLGFKSLMKYKISDNQGILFGMPSQVTPVFETIKNDIFRLKNAPFRDNSKKLIFFV